MSFTHRRPIATPLPVVGISADFRALQSRSTYRHTSSRWASLAIGSEWNRFSKRWPFRSERRFARPRIRRSEPALHPDAGADRLYDEVEVVRHGRMQISQSEALVTLRS